MQSIPVGVRLGQVSSNRRALPVSAMDGVPFCDYLNVSVPLEHESAVMAGIAPVLDMVGLCESEPGVYRFATHRGVFKRRRRGRVLVLSASGGVLERLRERVVMVGGEVQSVGLMDQYLAALASVPHRVTSIDVAADFIASGPDVMRAIRRDALGGKIFLTRKRVDPRNVKEVFGRDADGRITGSVYMGKPANADVFAKAYDKRHERVSRGFADPGPRVRVEPTAKSDVGATLHDAQFPSGLFYHLASPCLVERPLGLEEWQPHGEGFVLPPRREWTVIERVQELLDTSADLARVFELVREGFGDNPLPRLFRMIGLKFGASASAASAAA